MLKVFRLPASLRWRECGLQLHPKALGQDHRHGEQGHQHRGQLRRLRGVRPPAYLSYGNGLWRSTNYDTDRVAGIGTSAANWSHQSLTYGFDTADHITASTNGVDAAQSPAIPIRWGFAAHAGRIGRCNVAQLRLRCGEGACITKHHRHRHQRRMLHRHRQQPHDTRSSIAGVTRNFTYNPVGDITPRSPMRQVLPTRWRMTRLDGWPAIQNPA